MFLRSLKSASRVNILNAHKVPSQFLQRNFWEWLNIVWNKVDENRIKEIGPDMACAEWLMRNGAYVKWSDESSFLTDYNALPEGKTHFIKEVDATDASITYMGFPYFAGCNHIERIKLHKCTYLDDQSMKNMKYVKDTLKYLHISSNGNISDEGVTSLGILSKLKSLDLIDLPAVKNSEACRQTLKTSLPSCQIKLN